MELSSTKPYFIRALYEWMVDNRLTPHLIVDTRTRGVAVLKHYVEDDRIVLNIAPSAARDLHIGNELLSFKARFRGAVFDIRVPVQAVEAIYAKETNSGMAFPSDDALLHHPPEPSGPTPSKKPQLKVIK
ncbi:MAG: ClpXP protease specificity-enhancing factor [Gammaproteobacteria bacterium]